MEGVVKRIVIGGCLGLFGLLTLAACSETPAPEAIEAERVVYTTFYPTTYFTERIAGTGEDAVPVVNPVPPDADPIFWNPPVETIEAYKRARLIVLNGASFEKWVFHAPLPRSRIVNTSDSFRDELIKIEGTVTHSHGPAGEHTHEGTDGHTWLDPNNAIRQARAIRNAMVDAFPEQSARFASGLDGLEADLQSLDGALSQATGSLSGVRLVASHPAYNYLATRYGWDIENLALDPDSDDAEVAKAAVLGVGNPDNKPIVLLWESEPRASVADALAAELGVRNVVFSPAELVEPERLEAGEDYLSTMRANIERLREAGEQ